MEIIPLKENDKKICINGENYIENYVDLIINTWESEEMGWWTITRKQPIDIFAYTRTCIKEDKPLFLPVFAEALGNAKEDDGLYYTLRFLGKFTHKPEDKRKINEIFDYLIELAINNHLYEEQIQLLELKRKANLYNINRFIL